MQIYKSILFNTILNCFILVFIIYYPVNIFALSPTKKIHQYVHKSWQIEDGLPQNSVLSITQTNNGYIWLGTEEGLVRFDGVNFTVFDKQNTEAITNSNIGILLTDSKDNLWIGTKGGGLVLYKNGQFSKFTTENGLKNNNVFSIYEDKKKNIWIGTKAGGLHLYKNGKLKIFNKKNEFSNNIVRTINEDRDGTLLIGTYGGGLYLYSNGKFIKANTENKLHNNIITITKYKNNTFLIGTDGRGLYLYKNKVSTVFPSNNSMSNYKTRSIYNDNMGNLWIATLGNGLVVYRKGKTIEFTTKDGLASDQVSCLYEDKEHNLWVGTKNGGLNMYRDGNITVFSTKDGITDNDVRAVYMDNKNRLWVGTAKSGLNYFLNNEFVTYEVKNMLSYSMITFIYRGIEDNLWVGTWVDGLILNKDGKFTTLTTKNGLSDNDVVAIYEEVRGKTWIGTFNKGLSLYENGKFTNYDISNGLSSNAVTSLKKYKDGYMLIGTMGGGLNLYKNGKITNFPAENKLSNKKVVSLYLDKKDNLWIGTWGGGLNLYKNNKFSSFTVDTGLFDDTIWTILEDAKENLWMSSNKGIFKVKKQELLNYSNGIINSITTKSYGIEDGMKTRECNGGFQAGLKTNDGKMYFPTIKGLAMIDPENLKINTILPQVLIENIIVDNRSYKNDNFNVIQPENGKLEFHYTATSFINTKKVLFKYKLDGFDKNWVDAGTMRRAYYTNLLPGIYTFKVKACNSDGIWNETGASFKFKKLPHYYQTIWFKVICFIVAAFLLFTIYRIRITQIKKRQLELEVLNQKLIEQERDRTLFFHNTSHELRTPLNGIIGFSRLIQLGHFGNTSKETAEQAGKIKQLAESLKFQVNTILNLAKSKKGEFYIVGGKINMNEIAMECELLAKGLGANKPNLLFKMETSWKNTQNIYFINDQEKILTILRNLLGNAFKFTYKNKKNLIKLKLELKNIYSSEVQNNIDNSNNNIYNTLIITVSDTGIGIAEHQLEIIFEEFKQSNSETNRNFEGTGLGLPMVKKIVELMNGEINLSSMLEKGTTFTLTIPAQKEEIFIKKTTDNSIQLSNLFTNELLKEKSAKDFSKKALFNSENSKIKILVVDDNELNVEMVEELLKSNGYTVQTAYGGKDALNAIYKEKPDLLLLDLMMPEVSGEDVLKEIKNSDQYNNIPVILLTARASKEDLLFGFSIGADDYLAKPIVCEELLLRVNSILFRVKLTKELVQVQESLIYNQKLAQLGESMGDLAHEMKNIFSSFISGFDSNKKRYHTLLSIFDKIHFRWVDLVNSIFLSSKIPLKNKLIRKKKLVISNKYPARKIKILKEIAEFLVELDIDDNTLFESWENIVKIDEDELVLLEMLLSVTLTFSIENRASTRAYQLMLSMLDNVRVESEKQCDLSLVVNSCIALIEKKFKKAMIKLNIDLPDKLLVSFNPSHFNQILFNLLINAHDVLKDNSNKNKIIKISFKKENNKVIFYVEDNGEGIKKEFLEKIFERNFSSKGNKGTGIGLFVSKKLAKKNNGSLKVFSKPGLTRFELKMDIITD